MQDYRNTITYTTPGPAGEPRSQQQRVIHGRKLTIAGAQRIIRRDTPDAVVTHISHTSEPGGSW